MRRIRRDWGSALLDLRSYLINVEVFLVAEEMWETTPDSGSSYLAIESVNT